jgi:hypothetical protein
MPGWRAADRASATSATAMSRVPKNWPMCTPTQMFDRAYSANAVTPATAATRRSDRSSAPGWHTPARAVGGVADAGVASSGSGASTISPLR